MQDWMEGLTKAEIDRWIDSRNEDLNSVGLQLRD